MEEAMKESLDKFETECTEEDFIKYAVSTSLQETVSLKERLL